MQLVDYTDFPPLYFPLDDFAQNSFFFSIHAEGYRKTILDYSLEAEITFHRPGVERNEVQPSNIVKNAPSLIENFGQQDVASVNTG